MKKIAVLIFIPLFLAGCGITSMFSSSSAPLVAPTKLKSIQDTLAVKELWSDDTGAGNPDPYTRLEPATGANRIYTADRKGQVTDYAIDDGTRVWRTRLDQPVTGGVGLGSGVVVVGTKGGEVTALDAATGKVRWHHQVSSEVLAPPAADAGIVVVRTQDGKLFGLSASDGHAIWIYERNVPPLTLRGTGAPLIDDGKVYTGFAAGTLVANDLLTGHDLWEATVAVPHGRNEIDRLVDIDAKPTVANGDVYSAAYQGRVAAIDGATGRVTWTRELSSYRRLAADAKNVYVTDDNSHVLALDRNTGATVWMQDGLVGRHATGPVTVGDAVAVADFEGYVHFLSKRDGSFVARVRVGHGPLDRPVSEGNRLYVDESDGTLTAFAVGGK